MRHSDEDKKPSSPGGTCERMSYDSVKKKCQIVGTRPVKTEHRFSPVQNSKAAWHEVTKSLQIMLFILLVLELANMYFMILWNELRTVRHVSRLFQINHIKINKVKENKQLFNLNKWLKEGRTMTSTLFSWVFTKENKRFSFHRKLLFSFSVLPLPLAHFSLLSLLAGTIKL